MSSVKTSCAGGPVRNNKMPQDREQDIKELVKANTDWQQYNEEREAFVLKLLHEIKIKDARITELERITDMTNRNSQVQTENRDLKRQLSEKSDELQGALNKVDELKRTLGERNSEFAVVQNQLQVFKEDFDSEREDRERVQSRLGDAETELAIVKRELQQYTLREMQDLSQRRQAALDYHRKEYERKHPTSLYQTDSHHSPMNTEEGEDEID